MNLSHLIVRLSLCIISLMAGAADVRGASAPGSIDLSFNNGNHRVPVPSEYIYEDARKVLVQADGKIVVVGTGRDGARVMTMRYHTDGSLDQTYGDQGAKSILVGEYCSGLGAALQADGKVVVVGYAQVNENLDLMLVRFGTNGQLDPTFGVGGIVTTDTGGGTDYAHDVAVQSDGKIVVGGSSHLGHAEDLVVARYNPTGALDTSFGTEGITLWAPETADAGGAAVAIQPDGKIVIAGTIERNDEDQLALVRFTAAGQIDPTFGEQGFVEKSLSSFGQSLADILVAPDGSIFAAGSSWMTQALNFVVVKVKSDGSFDNTFGTNGTVATDIGGSNDTAVSIARQPDGKLVVGGCAQSSEYYDDSVVVRYLSNGTLDSSFANGGKFVAALSSLQDRVASVALQADGKILAVGESHDENPIARLSLFRLNNALGPTVNLGSPTIAGNAITLRGTANGNMAPEGTAVVFEYGPSPSKPWTMVFATPSLVYGNTDIPVQATLSGLLPNNIYYYQIHAANANGAHIIEGQFRVPAGDSTNLGILDIEGASFSPSFTSGISQYSGELYSSDTKSVRVSAPAEDPLATVKINGTVVADGKYSAPIPLNIGLNAITVQVTAHNQTDSKTYTFDITRPRPPTGSMDLDFGLAGKAVVRPYWYESTGRDVLQQPDGKVLVAGSAMADARHGMAISRYNPDGSPDFSFGGRGRALKIDQRSDEMVGNMAALQTDGKILVAGVMHIYNETRLAVVRFTTEGKVDDSFGEHGLAEGSFGGKSGEGHGLAVRPNGKILVAGFSTDGQEHEPMTGDRGPGVVLTQFDSNGSLDATFGGGGKVFTSLAQEVQMTAMILQPDGKAIVTGHAKNGDKQEFLTLRYDSSGVLDPGFGSNGVVRTSFAPLSGCAQSVVLQANGSIVVAGHVGTGYDTDVALVRYSSTGVLDQGFGNGGKVITSLEGPSVANDVLVQPDTKILIGGTARLGGSDDDFLLIRYTNDGNEDIGFNEGELSAVRVFQDAYSQKGHGITLQGDGKILLTGGTGSAFFSEQMALLQVNNDVGPGILSMQITQVTPTSATFTGRFSAPGINGNSSTVSLRRVQAGLSNWQTVPLSASELAAGSSALVTGTMANLSPGTTYRYQATITKDSNHVSLDGYFATPSLQEGWRQQWFGSAANTGGAADSYDYESDGISNLMEWAVGLDPTKTSVMPAVTKENGANLEYVYSRSVTAMNAGVGYFVEWSDTLPGTLWSVDGVTEEIVTNDGTIQQVKVIVPKGSGDRRFVRLRVVAPQ